MPAEIMLRNGELLTEEEILEGFCLLAESESSFPLLSRDDRLKSLVALAFRAADFGNEEDS